jgi:ATPase subunit of ABC transporter with duplicated ATPase domains
MLKTNNLSKSYGLTPLFHSVTFTILPGERVGLVGPNGSGKTTLLRILTGEEQADAGTVQRTPAGLRAGYLSQGLAFGPEDSLASFIARMEGDVPALSARIEQLAEEMMRINANPHLQQEYDRTLDLLQQAAENAGRAPGMLAALGLNHLPPDLPVAALSGGQKTRLALAGVLLSAPQLLLLDEPTNHLDLEMLAWLEDWLLSFPGAALVVSHDRAFLDRVATAIVEIDPLTRTTKRYEGNYSAYLDQKIAENERQWQAFKDQQDEISRLQGSARHMRGLAKFHKGGKADPENTDGFSVGFFSNRGKETIQKAKNIEKRIDRLMNEDHIDKPGRTWQMKMEFGEVASSGRMVLALENLSVGYPGDLPARLPGNTLLSGLNQTIRYGARIALVGPNGAGKTTLLRTIADLIPPLEGAVRLGANVRVGYMTQEHEHLDLTLNPLETLQSLTGKPETEIRSFLSKFLFKGDDVFTPAGSLSYGERARLSLAGLAAQGCNFLLLDEPINHLDIPARASFEQALAAFEGTCLAVVHDRYFIEGYATEVWEVREGGITVIA